MREYVVQRTGQAPLRLQGEVVAAVESSPYPGERFSGIQGKYVRIKIYRTADAKYVAAISWVTLWAHDYGKHHDVGMFSSLERAVDWLHVYAPEPEMGWLLRSLPPGWWEVKDKLEVSNE